jgi:uroporphyrinogen decarboxylase
MGQQMTGLEKITRVMTGEAAADVPVLPILHTGLAGLFGVSLGRYFTQADLMADVIVQGYRRFGYDGVQLTLGVTAEAEALGAATEQPADGAPILRERLLDDFADLDRLRERDVATGGRLPLFYRALEMTARRIGSEAFILATLRGPFLIASQLRGVEAILIDLLESPEAVERILDFAVDVAEAAAGPALAAGAHGVVLGEAVCSPSFLSPALYRRLIRPRHCALVARLKDQGWRHVGLHVCGNTLPILDDLISTGADFLDVDYQAPAAEAIAQAAGRVALRGNLDPGAVLRFGTPERVRLETARLLRQTAAARWIMSSGCDIPPGTPAANIAAFMEVIRGSAA